MQNIMLSIVLMLPFIGYGQSYTSYITGNNSDIVTNPMGGICLMGGASEDDNAMKWFLQRADGGDVLVLRASGSDGYNSYLYSDLGIPVNSVETIVCHNATASEEAYVVQKIEQAEAIWFAGGDQWTYISYWRNTTFNTAINQAIQQRNIVIGGTSAGMAIQGGYYFSAQNGTVTSSTALGNPYNQLVTVDSTAFLDNTILKNTITDTHFDNPDRKGRLVTFLARINTDYGVYAKAIACDEYTAVCIDTEGFAKVFGGHPTYDDNAYFVQSNCELSVPSPENCIPGNALTWNLEGKALKVYHIKGNSTASNSFNLNTWQTGTGGTWHDWSVTNGILSEQTANAINCPSLNTENLYTDSGLDIFPNPATDECTLRMNNGYVIPNQMRIYNQLGQELYVRTAWEGDNITVDISSLRNGIYFIIVCGNDGKTYTKKLIKN